MSHKQSTTTIIAEVGSVHDGSFGNAIKLIEAAKSCMVDAVKFQTHIAEAETLRDAPKPSFFKGEPRYEYFKRTAFKMNQWIELKNYAESYGLTFLSSPFSMEAVKLLESIGIEQWKIPSGEVTNLPMLETIAKTNKPILLSSGMSSWDELDDAVNIILKHTNKLTVLQCTTEYPCSYENVGLNIMQEMKSRYNLPVGLSDHTLSNYSAFAAVLLGATVIEKHFTFSRLMYGSDAKHSLELDEFKDLVQGIRAIEIMINIKKEKVITLELAEHKKVFEKSIVTNVEINKGQIITKEMLTLKKPGTGIKAKYMGTVIGKMALRDISANCLLNESDISDFDIDIK